MFYEDLRNMVVGLLVAPLKPQSYASIDPLKAHPICSFKGYTTSTLSKLVRVVHPPIRLV